VHADVSQTVILGDSAHYDLGIWRCSTTFGDLVPLAAIVILQYLATFRDLGPKEALEDPSVPYVPLSGLRRKSFGGWPCGTSLQDTAPPSMIAVCGSTGPDTEPEPPQTAIMETAGGYLAFNPTSNPPKDLRNGQLRVPKCIGSCSNLAEPDYFQQSWTVCRRRRGVRRGHARKRKTPCEPLPQWSLKMASGNKT